MNITRKLRINEIQEITAGAKMEKCIGRVGVNHSMLGPSFTSMSSPFSSYSTFVIQNSSLSCKKYMPWCSSIMLYKPS